VTQVRSLLCFIGFGLVIILAQSLDAATTLTY